MAPKIETVYSLILYRKSLLTPVLQHMLPAIKHFISLLAFFFLNHLEQYAAQSRHRKNIS